MTRELQNKPVIVYLITQLDLGGAQKVCLSLFNQNNKAGITSYLITGNCGILADTYKNNPQVFFINSMQRTVALQSLIHEIRCFIQMVKIITTLKKRHPYLIAHTHSTKAGLLGRWAAFFARVPVVHTIHGFAFHPFQSRIKNWAIYGLEYFTSLITTHFVCVSSADQLLAKKFPRFMKKQSIIRAGIDTSFFERKGIKNFPQKKIFIFGSIACFKPQKNIVDTLRAFAWVYQRNDKVRLELIGDGAERSDIESFIAEHGLSSSVTLHGWQHDIPSIMRHWHSFLLTSLWEGLPCAIAEAKCFQLPVLAYNTGGIKDLIQHGKNGMLYAHGDWQSMALDMHVLTRDQELFKKLQRQPRNLYHFHENYMHEHHGALYCKLQSNKHHK